MFYVYAIPEPGIKIYLLSDNVKKIVCDRYLRVDYKNIFYLSCNISFTEDVGKAVLFTTREVALKTADFLTSVIPEDFKIDKVEV